MFRLRVKHNESELVLEMEHKDCACASTTTKGYSSQADNDVLLKTIEHICKQVKELDRE